MHTRDDVRPASRDDDTSTGRLLDGLGRTTLLALAALAGCAVLIVLGATVSMCWSVHPLLSAVAALGLLWCLARTAGRAFRSSPRPH
jgi:hypothetical protein